MKIFLIDPPGDQKGWNAGLAYLSGALSMAGIEHTVLDMVNVKVSDEEMLSLIRSFGPDIVGISVKTATYYSAVHVAEEIRMAFPKIAVIAGGPHATLYHEELLREAGCFDAAALGDAEESLAEFARAYSPGGAIPPVAGMARREKGAAVCEPGQAPMDLDSLAPPEFAHHIRFDPAWQPYPLVTSRGCPYGCIFCSVGRVSGRKWRSRSPASVVDELERAHQKWGFREFDVLDDNFTQDVDRAREICRLLIERKLNMRWSCPNGIRADRVTPDLMSGMARSGCHTVIFGVESADPELFNSIHKGETLGDVARAIGLAKDAGMRAGGYFIIGLPGDSYEKNMRGLDFAREVGLDWAHFNILAPYPGVRVWDEIGRRGRFIADYRKAQHFSARIRPIFELNDFSAADIANTYKTVHVRQKLYHLLLPPDLGKMRKRFAISRLRAAYDREAWLKDIRRDAIQIARNAFVPLRAAFWEFGRRAPRHPPAVYRPAGAGLHLKVLMVNDYIGRAGGTERYIYDLVNNLTQDGHRVAWAYEKDVGSDDVAVPKYPMTGLAGPAPEGKTGASLDLIMKEFAPDVIHIHNVHAPGIVREALKRAATIRTVHDHNIVCPSMNKMWMTGEICNVPAGLRCMERLLDGGCSVIGMRPGLLGERLSLCIDGIAANQHLAQLFVTTNFMRDELIQNGFDPARIETLPLPLEFPPDPQPSDESLPLEILWAGRIVLPDKGADFFIESLRYMRAPFHAVVAGDGPQMDFVMMKARELNLDDKVEFPGKVSQEQMDELYRKSHVVVFTPMWAEPFGYVGVEAAAHGRAVVAFKAGGVSDWLEDRKGGFLARRGDCRALAARLDRLAYIPRDRRIMGRAHREAAMERHNKDRHMARLVQIYRDIIS